MHEIDQTKLTDQTKFRLMKQKRSIKYYNNDFILIKKINKVL